MSEKTYWFDINGEKVPNLEAMLSKLLEDDILFCNTRKFQCPFSKEICEDTIVLFININDTFCYAADSECLTTEELPKLFELYQKKEYYGVVEFVALKINLQPLKRTKDQMIKLGFWTEELEKCGLNN